jgi:hypothetical protein
MSLKNKPKPKFGELGLSAWIRDPQKFRADFERSDDFVLRQMFRPKFEKMRKRSDFGDVVNTLRQYIQECLPAPRLTEREWWCITSLPSTGDGRRISACNIHWMEIFVLSFSKDDTDKVCGFINVARNILLSTYESENAFSSKYPFAWFEYPFYERSAGTAGIDTVTIQASGLKNIRTLLNDDVILDAARHLNWHVLHLGRTAYERFHCYDLADLLL